MRVVVTTTGSLGDLHPYLAIALGLRDRGHAVSVATSPCYRAKIAALGLAFHPVRPDSDFVTDPVRMRRIMGRRLGTVVAVCETMLPALPEAYADLRAATAGADLLVSHVPWAARLVAETTGIPWVSTTITPLGFFSTHDLPVFPLLPWLSGRLRSLGPAFWRPVFGVGKWLTRPWAEPWYRLRDELGLPPAPDLNPLGDSHSPRRVLALFSPVLAPPQPDWPPQTVVTGFPFFDRDGAAGLAPDLARFLDEGPPPVVFTLGDSAAAVAGRFFEESAAAAGWLGRRAVLVGGQAHRDRPWPAGVLAVPYAPYGALFPRAAAVVHAGGIGTTGLVLRAGRPALVLPFAHDQPDNAARATRLGTARTLPAHRYRADRAAEALRPLLDDPEVAARTAAIGARVRAEDGVGAACAALEEAISSPLRRATRPLLPVGPASSPGRRP